MKRSLMARAVVLAVVSVWTYGSEAVDIIAQRAPQDASGRAFLQALQCEARKDGHVYCKVDGQWKTTKNETLPIPWGLE